MKEKIRLTTADKMKLINFYNQCRENNVRILGVSNDFSFPPSWLEELPTDASAEDIKNAFKTWFAEIIDLDARNAIYEFLTEENFECMDDLPENWEEALEDAGDYCDEYAYRNECMKILNKNFKGFWDFVRGDVDSFIADYNCCSWDYIIQDCYCIASGYAYNALVEAAKDLAKEEE